MYKRARRPRSPCREMRAGRWTLVPLSCGCGSRPTAAPSPLAAPWQPLGGAWPAAEDLRALTGHQHGERHARTPTRHRAHTFGAGRQRGMPRYLLSDRPLQVGPFVLHGLEQALSARPHPRTLVAASGRPPSGSYRRRSRCSQSVTSSHRHIVTSSHRHIVTSSHRRAAAAAAAAGAPTR